MAKSGNGKQQAAGVTGVPRAAARYAKRVQHTARNVAEVVRFGGLETNEEYSPYTVEAELANYRLRHYFADDVPDDAMPILLVPPLMMSTEVWDVSPDTSGVAAMHAAGADPWVVDFGDPDVEAGGRERNLTDHVLAVSDAVDRIVKATGRSVVLSGYSQGGMFAYQVAAYRRGDGIDSLVTFGSPVDTTAPLPIPIAPDVAARLSSELVDSGLLRKITVPSWFVRLGFKMLDPARSVQDRAKFLLALNDRDALLPREKQRRFLDSEGWTAYSGPAIAELLEQFVTHNRMLEGGFIIDERLVTLADIDLPILTFVGTTDTLGHPVAVRAIDRAAPRATVYEVTLPGGHFGLVVGSKAMTITWPTVADWMAWRAGAAQLPDTIALASTIEPQKPHRAGAAATAAAQTVELGLGVSRSVLSNARRASRLVRNVAREAPAQLPRLARIEQLDPNTRISLGRLLDEQARRSPDNVAFLFGDRAHRHWDVKERVDNVVKGLVHVGVRQGDRVGMLMGTRPSAFVLVAALSRIGATAVLLRPDGDAPREAALAEMNWMISDPEHVDLIDSVPDVRWAVLGAGSKDAQQWRKAHPDAIDMESIDIDNVELPAWYRPNPHRAADVAFVLFTGEGRSTNALTITNRRWALSALGTASAASLNPGHTVYSVTPFYHSSSLLMSVGGAIAGGARFAMASADDPDTFWEEVRRYGATHVSYTWASLLPVVDAPANPNERYHPIKMFIGSGMPRNLWRRVDQRFPTAKVVEFYASAQGEAILANLSGRATGSMGKSLPGTPEVRVAAYDFTEHRLEIGADGLGRECAPDEVGLLLVRASAADAHSGAALRGVFASDDAWRSSDDLFLRDENGDLWLAGPVAEVIDTADGEVLPSGARFALSSISVLDLIVAYGVPEGDAEVLVAAVTVRKDAELTADDLDKALRRLPALQRPKYVQALPSIPLTTWHRPQWRPLQAKGVPKPTRTRHVWRLNADTGRYEASTP
ncbi:alpha/beta fold hydrolase [uncultured Jatrophihabitans sp.]|uniref:alpha/beta fold hydrolase n=1 Tax=uncultured Jatrophihabitans sp. TaxID=1610747 RepID=UPI0035CA676D